MRVFQPLAPRARFGTDLTRTHTSPFIGREIDLALLKGIFDKTVASTSVQLVTVVGEPGLGKSRIVAELFAYIDARPELVTWRQGRCLPYGEGITFWALGEIVKAHAGILESDAPERRRRPSSTSVLPEGEERAWFRQRLLPLLGIEASSSAEREELFTAWRRFLEHIAETRSDGAGVRGSALGRRGDARVPGAPGRSRRGRPAADRRHRPAGAVRAPPRLRGRAAERELDQPGAAVAGGDGAARLGAAGRDRDPGRAAAADPRSRRRQPAVRRGVRPAAEGQGPARPQGVELGASRGSGGAVPGLGAGADRRPPGHARARREVAARRRGGDRQGVLGRRRRRDGRTATATTWSDALRELSRKELVRAVAPLVDARARPSTRSGTSSPAMSPTPSSRAPRAPRGMSPPRRGSSRRHPSGSRTSPTCSPTTTRPPSTSPAPPERPTRPPSWRRRPSGSSPWPANARSASTPPRRSPTSSGRSRSPHPDTPTGRRRSPASARPPSTPAAPSRRRRRWRRRSHRFQERGDLPATAHAMHVLASLLHRLADPRWVDAAGRGPGTAGAVAQGPRARRGAHRGRACGLPARRK